MNLYCVIQSFEWKKVVWDIPNEVYRKNLGMVTELLELGGLYKTFVRELLRQLSETSGVRDVEIKKAPIEQVIAGLYREWFAGRL